MDLVIDQMVQLQEVGIADSDQIVEGFAGTAVVEDGLAVFSQTCQLQVIT